ncbi:hypothetical protein Tco_0654499 [Tanacetum coccineum]|uniref:Uncharacterized protein n=1 Tax=Tanacetum coccineum TaxID=301880 RepID=A0ABQ4X3I1_9ASTR
MVDSQPMEKEFQGVTTRDAETKTHGGPTEPVLRTQKTHSPSPTLIKENIDVLRTMIKEHDQQGKMKATPRKLSYADSEKEAPVESLAKGFFDRFSLESSNTSDTHNETHSTIKSQKTPSKNKEPTHLRRSRRLENQSTTKEKARRERSKSRRKMAKLSRNIRVYEGNKDPDDHLGPEDLKEPETGGPREARRNIEVYTPYPRKDTFTSLTKTPKEILAMESVSFPEPQPLIGTPEKQNLNKFCDYHGDRGHNTNDSYQLKKQIEEAVASGKLAHLVKDIR